MASVLKVDTLQKPDGTAPTAADLGIDVADTVVKVGSYKFSGQQYITSTSNVAITDSSFSYTPKGVGNKLIITPTVHCNINDTANAAGAGLYVYINGVQQNYDVNHSMYFNGGNNSTTDFYWMYTQPIYYTTVGTSPITIQLYAAMYQSDDNRIAINNGSNQESYITVYEIAQ